MAYLGEITGKTARVESAKIQSAERDKYVPAAIKRLDLQADQVLRFVSDLIVRIQPVSQPIEITGTEAIKVAVIGVEFADAIDANVRKLESVRDMLESALNRLEI